MTPVLGEKLLNALQVVFTSCSLGEKMETTLYAGFMAINIIIAREVNQIVSEPYMVSAFETGDVVDFLKFSAATGRTVSHPPGSSLLPWRMGHLGSQVDYSTRTVSF